MEGEKIERRLYKTLATWYNSFDQKLTEIYNLKIAVKFEENCLQEDKVSFTSGKVRNFLFNSNFLLG